MLCRLVQLIEAPVFTSLRLQLLHPKRYPALMRAMYSLLMLCPQSNAFQILHARLSSIPTMALLQLEETSEDWYKTLKETSSNQSLPEIELPWNDMLEVCLWRTALQLRGLCGSDDTAKSGHNLQVDMHKEMSLFPYVMTWKT